nr:DNA cytosine methyltransferase [Helicobacter pylori]
MTSIELFAGAGGLALGLELAGFCHIGLVEIDRSACSTLKKNRPLWNVLEKDIYNTSRTRSRANFLHQVWRFGFIKWRVSMPKF